MQRYLVGWGRTTSEVADRRILRAHAEKLPCAQKNIFMGIEIYLRAHENLATLAKRNKPLFNSKLNYHDQD